jgi:hypothetical protein
MHAGDLAYPGSPMAEALYLRQEQAFDLTRPGIDDEPTWLGGARDIVVNTSHPLVASSLHLAEREPELGAQLLAQGIALHDGVDHHKTVELARTALGWRGAR